VSDELLGCAGCADKETACSDCIFPSVLLIFLRNSRSRVRSVAFSLALRRD
jgi:hypothetical protein